MFLPVLLIHDFGLGGWLVFAIPNVVGAAMMGVALRSRQSADRFVIDHPVWTTLFSWVVLAFHAFFCAWMAATWLTIEPGATYELPPGARGLAIAVVLVILTRPALVALLALSLVFAGGIVISRLSFRSACATALVLWGVSIGVVLNAASPVAGEAALSIPAMTGSAAVADLLWIVPICVFGFALCPYFDLTFLRVRRETPGATGAAAFIIGFGVLFLAMIGLTLLYAEGVARTWRLPAMVAAHMLIQMIFTVGVHLREITEMRREPRALPGAVGLVLVGAGAVIPIAGHAMDVGLVTYKSFLWFYGLLFPAAMWICVLGGLRQRVPARLRLTLFVVSVALATPMFWGGFIEKDWWMLAPGVLIPISAPLLFLVVRGPAPEASASGV